MFKTIDRILTGFVSWTSSFLHSVIEVVAWVTPSRPADGHNLEQNFNCSLLEAEERGFSGVDPEGRLSAAGSGKVLKARELWKGPVVVIEATQLKEYFVKEQAKIWASKRADIETLGFKLVAVVQEEDAKDALSYGEVFKGEVLVDLDQVIFNALGGGTPKIQATFGTPTTMGGVLILLPGGNGHPVYGWSEDLIGGNAPVDDVILPLLRELAGEVRVGLGKL